MTTENGAAEASTDADNVDTGAAGADSQKPEVGAADANGSVFDADTVFAGLEAENREWLVKQGYASEEGVTPAEATKLLKQVYAQEKLLGNAIRVPGEKATPEEREAFLNKLGRPEKADGYEFSVPENLPEELPYDGERATEFKAIAHKLGLNKDQAAGLHDWFAEKQVADFGKQGSAKAESDAELARAATEKLVKRWGPLDGETARANLELGNRFINEAGGPEALAEAKRFGIVSEDGSILSEPLAVMFANAGVALYREDGMLKGNPDRINNPFAEGDGENVTEQMRITKKDPAEARALIAAAGRKPSDFGLQN